MVFLLAAIGCGSAPEVTLRSVTPASVSPGSAVELRGDGLGPGTVFWLQGPRGDVPLPVRWEGDGVHAIVPELPPGVWSVLAMRGPGTASAPLEIVRSPDEAPCARPYQANTQLSVADGLAVVDRFYADGTRERVETRLGEIARLELLAIARPDGSICSAILLRRTDGVAVIYEDDDGVDLRPRAETLARFMAKDLEISQ